MCQVSAGFFAGAVSGVFMGLVSDILFRLGIFKSSLIIIDGSFLFRTLKLKDSPSLMYAAGLSMHIITSAVFGGIYIIGTALTGLNALSPGLVALYIAFLWLSMLFIALPVAGEGFIGKKSGPMIWLEQLILHCIFCALYYMCLHALL